MDSRLVPWVPTQAMLDAATRAVIDGGETCNQSGYWTIYQAMLSAAPPVEGGEAVAWMISDTAGDLATVVTLRPQDPVSKAGLVITPLYTRPAESEALLLRCRTVLASWGDEIGDATALAAEIDEYLKGRT